MNDKLSSKKVLQKWLSKYLFVKLPRRFGVPFIQHTPKLLLQLFKRVHVSAVFPLPEDGTHGIVLM